MAKDPAGQTRRTTGSGTRRAVLLGLTLGAVVVILLAAVAGLAIWTGRAKLSTGAASAPGAPALFVFEGHGADGSRSAAFMLVTRTDGTSKLIDPTVPIALAGVTETLVAEAPAFASASAIAKTLSPNAPLRAVGVPESLWRRALDAQGPVRIVIPKAIDVYDGSKLHSYDFGEADLTSGDFSPLAEAAGYLPRKQRGDLLGQLASAVVRAMATAGTAATDQMDTELSAAEAVGILKRAAETSALPEMTTFENGVTR